MPTILQTNDLHKSFKMGDATVKVLRGVNLSVEAGEFLAIEGRSGSGKSTLLHLLGGLDEPDTGGVLFDGRPLFELSAVERSAVRNQSVGFIFQFYHLLPEFDVMGNVLLSAAVRFGWFSFRRQKAELRTRAETIIDSLGLRHRMHHRPNQLSGGERQRVAIARALMNAPRVLLADEPTGNLDIETGLQIMSVLENLHRNGQTVVMVTHDRTIAKRADRVVVMKDGQLE